MKNKKIIHRLCVGFLCGIVAFGAMFLHSSSVRAKDMERTAVENFQKIKLSKYMIKSATYKLPNFSVAEVFVREDGGEKRAVLDEKFTVTANDSLEFFYNVDGQEYTHFAKVVDVKYGGAIEIDKYFAVSSGNAQISSDDSCTTFNFEEDVAIQFINILDVSDLNIEFEFSDNIGYTNAQIVLEDVATEKTITVTYEKTSKAWNAVLGEVSKRVSSSDGYSFGYNANDKQVIYNARTMVDVLTYDDGTEFEGFTDNMAVLTVKFNNVSSASTYEMISINKHRFADLGEDFTAPKIVVDTINTSAYHDEVFTINGGYAIDVLDPAVDFVVTVTDDNGDVITATNGVVLQNVDARQTYEFYLTKYGKYTVSYSATDGAGRKATQANQISVVDDIKPTITLGSKTTTGSVGKTVTVASATYSDNVTLVENLIINVYVQSPTLVVTTINGSFVPKSAGTYTVMYVAIDEMYNLSVVTYEVEVK